MIFEFERRIAKRYVGHRDSLRIFPSSDHALVHAISQLDSHLMRTGVVLSGRHVAATSRDVNLLDRRVVSPPSFTCEANEVRSYPATTVIAHRMSRIAVQCCNRFVAVPKTDRF